MHIDTGNTGFMLLCTSLVMLMTPGLAFFYGGLVGRKNVLAIMMQSFVSMGWTTVIWFAVGYSLCFSRRHRAAIIGNLDMAFLNGVTLDTPSPLNATIPMIVFIAYQMMFAIITPALITGAFANRVTFKAYMLFLTVWLLFVYFPFVHMIWGGGILAAVGRARLRRRHRRPQHRRHRGARLGPLRRPAAGRRRGAAQHPARGPRHRPALVRLVRLQRRQRVPRRLGDRRRVPQHRHRRVVRGDRLAGDRLVHREAADVPRAADRRGRRPGHDHPGGRLRLAGDGGADRHRRRASSATAPSRSRTGCSWDDALDVWGVHGVGGFLGIVLLGVFATTAFNPAGADGLLAGNADVLPQAGRRPWLLVVGLGVRLHLRDALADRPGDAGQGG